MTKTGIGLLAIAALVFAFVSEAQEKTPAAQAKSPEVVQKSGRPTGAAPDGKNSAAAAPAPAASAKDSAGDAKTTKAAPADTVEKDDTKPGPVAAGAQRPGTAIRRDPFRPITSNLRANVRRRENLSPLERYELGQLKLVGIIWNIKNPTALVEDSTGLGYTVKVGTAIGPNDGKVKAIRPDGLVIEEEYIDLYGAKKRQEVSMRLPVERSE